MLGIPCIASELWPVHADQKRGQSTSHVPILAPLAIGFAVFVCHLAAIPLDGCSINPARSFGPAVTAGVRLAPASCTVDTLPYCAVADTDPATQHWHNLWIFFSGPFSGAVIAALTYELTFRSIREPVLTMCALFWPPSCSQQPNYPCPLLLPHSSSLPSLALRPCRAHCACQAAAQACVAAAIVMMMPHRASAP